MNTNIAIGIRADSRGRRLDVPWAAIVEGIHGPGQRSVDSCRR